MGRVSMTGAPRLAAPVSILVALSLLMVACTSTDSSSGVKKEGGGGLSGEAVATPTAVMAYPGSRSARVTWSDTNPVGATAYTVTATPGTATPGTATPGTGATTSASNAGATAGSASPGTAAPANATCTSTYALSCVVVGLTPGTPYTFTVAATTAGATSAASAPSASTTPGSCDNAYGTVTGPSVTMTVVNTTPYPDNEVYVALTGKVLDSNQPTWGVAPCDHVNGSVPITSLPKGLDDYTYMF